MPAKNTKLVNWRGKPIAEPRQLDSGVHFSLRSIFLSNLLLPTFPILPVFAPRFTPMSSLTLTLLWTPPSLQRSLQFPLHSYSRSASLTTPLCNAISTPLSSLYSTLHCFYTSLSTPLCNCASSLLPAFSANVLEPGQARGWRVSLPHPDHRVACDEDTTRYEHGNLRALACDSGHVLHEVKTRGSKSGAHAP